MHSNLDSAIEYVLEHGQELNVPNVFAVYLQAIIHHHPYADDGDEDRLSMDQTDDAIARAALVTFERAMDKYPMPVLLPPSTKTKKSKGKPSTATTATTMPGTDGAKKYPLEVAQLRWQYQRATAADGEYQGCTCASCGGLLAMREGLSGLGSEGEGEGWEGEWTLDPPPRVRRTRESALVLLLAMDDDQMKCHCNV